MIKIRITLLLTFLTLPILLFSQQSDSLANTDSLATVKYWGLRPKPLKSPLLSPQFYIGAPNKYQSTLKLGKPYRPKVDFHRMDLRGTSNYTPPWVQKGHLIDMGRDPGTFWLSPYTVALLGLAMLEKYYLREQLQDMFSSPSLEPGNLFAAEPNWQIMEALWEKSPQTIGELSVNPRVGFRFRGKKLEEALKILADNYLIYSELLT